MTDNITHITDTTFDEEVLKADGPVLVDYWAEWCGPCKMIAPIIEELADEYGDRLKVAKIDIDRQPCMTPPQVWYSRHPYPDAVQRMARWKPPRWEHCPNPSSKAFLDSKWSYRIMAEARSVGRSGLPSRFARR